MLNTLCLFRRSAKLKALSGFTLVELLVVIGIIAILAGVALGPITNGIKKAKQSSALQSAHAIGISMYAAANDNNQKYPYVVGGTGASDYAKNLLAGGYVTDPSIFIVGTGTTRTAYTGVPSTAATGLAASNVSWDFVESSSDNINSNLDSTSYQYLPIMWTTVQGTGIAAAALKAAANQPITATPQGGTAGSPFSTDGMAVFYINNASKFITSKVSGSTYSTTLVPASSNSGDAANLSGVAILAAP